ncbi:MAG: branched-chain amino acid ABC transporter permease [Solirubrobacteraceae bacterium]|nr:branched-chain amino acid ABC transporter permease [Solirubrobacteraceae bacterium]
MSSRVRGALVELVPLIALLVVVALVGSSMSDATQQDFITALIAVTIVVALHVFVGNSGVISFGHISFVAVGAFAAGVLTIPAVTKPLVMPELWSFLADTEIGNLASLALAAALGAIYALVFGFPLMRLSGLAAGIATFAVLEITHNVLRFWEKIGPGAKTLTLVPVTTEISDATVGAIVAVLVAFAYQRTRRGRVLRASREDPAAAQAIGVRIHRERLLAFVLSGALAGLAGGLLVHQLGSITTEQVYLQLTFLTLAMLVIGGVGSLWGAVVGALLISFLNTLLGDAENGLGLGPVTVTIPDGSSLVILGVLMTLVLLLRPGGLSGGRELSLRRRRRRPTQPVRPSAGPPDAVDAAPSARDVDVAS